MLASRRLKRLVSQEVSIIPGETYDTSAWIKTQDLDRTGACIEFIWLKSGGGVGYSASQQDNKGEHPGTYCRDK